mgnify:FL=1
MTDWLPIATFALNLLIIPLLKVLVDIRIELTRINGKIQAHEQRLDRIERHTEVL